MNTDRFKFRVWDDTQKQYLDSDFRIRSDSTIFYDGISLADEELSDLVFEQCTGLKDANGKLIYEGDILQTPSYRYCVKYDDKTCGFVCDEYLDGCSALLLHSDLASKKYRVFGNIHENPERLEGNK